MSGFAGKNAREIVLLSGIVPFFDGTSATGGGSADQIDAQSVKRQGLRGFGAGGGTRTGSGMGRVIGASYAGFG